MADKAGANGNTIHADEQPPRSGTERKRKGSGEEKGSVEIGMRRKHLPLKHWVKTDHDWRHKRTKGGREKITQRWSFRKWRARGRKRRVRPRTRALLETSKLKGKTKLVAHSFGERLCEGKCHPFSLFGKTELTGWVWQKMGKWAR